MAHILKRRKALLAAAEKPERELFARRISGLMEEYKKEERRKEVVKAFDGLASCWNTAGRDQAASLGICYLYSSILMRNYEFKLVLLGEDFWLEEEPITTSWVPPCFFEHFEEDMDVLMKALRSSFPRLCRAEEEAVRAGYWEYYLAAVSKLCRDMAEEILLESKLAGINKTDHFYLFFGKFQGEGEILWQMEESKGKD